MLTRGESSMDHQGSPVCGLVGSTSLSFVRFFDIWIWHPFVLASNLEKFDLARSLEDQIHFLATWQPVHFLDTSQNINTNARPRRTRTSSLKYIINYTYLSIYIPRGITDTASAISPISQQWEQRTDTPTSIMGNGSSTLQIIQDATVDFGSPWAKVESDDDYMVMGLTFNVPLDHQKLADAGNTIALHASLVYEKKPSANAPHSDTPLEVFKAYRRSGATKKPWLVYLCGGPGDGNSFKKVPGVTEFGIERGYQILFLDYRGTGQSQPFPGPHPTDHTNSDKLTDYLGHFTQFNIVQDLEGIRLWFSRYLGIAIRFTLLAQSFGGWIAITYLSHLPSSLKCVLLTAAMPPFAKSPTDVYKALYKRVINRNEEFYRRYPADAARLHKIVTHLHTNGPYPVSGGRLLTAQTIMTLGRVFGASGGFERVHDFLTKATADLEKHKSLTPETLDAFADKNLESFRLHQRPLYGLIHEAIYCNAQGVTSDWAALSVGKEIGGLQTKTASAAASAAGTKRGHEQSPQTSPRKRRQKGHHAQDAKAVVARQAPGCFSWLEPAFDPSAFPQSSKLYFSGEMIFPFMFDFHSGDGSNYGPDVLGLPPGLVAKVAENLAKKTDWPDVYDVESLKKNAYRVPVRSLVYKGDMYVDWEVSVEMGGMIGGPCEVLVVGPGGDVQVAVSNKISGTGAAVSGGGVVDVDADLAGEWEWSHGAVMAEGKTEKVLGLLFDGVCW